MRRIIVCFAGLFLVLHAIPSSTQDKHEGLNDFADVASDGEWRIENEKIFPQGKKILKREIISLWPEINANTIGCSRYCVQKRILDGVMENVSLKRINIIWSIGVNQTAVTLRGESTTSWEASSNQKHDLVWEHFTFIPFEKSDIFYSDDPMCELYIELGCESYAESNSNNSTIPDESSKSDQHKLVTINYPTGHGTTVFSVNEVTEKLTIFALGKLSQAILEIPIAPRQNDSPNPRKTRPTFSLSRTTDAKGVRIDARNPPAGEWRLMLSGMKDLNYSFSVKGISSRKIVQNVEAENNEPTTARPLTNEVTFEDKEDESEVNENEKLSRSHRLAYMRANDDNDTESAIKSNDEQLPIVEHLANNSEVAQSSLQNGTKFFTKFSRKMNLEVELMEPEIRGRITVENPDDNGRIYEDPELDEVSRIAGEIRSSRPRTVIDLSPITQLLARPGTYHDIIFTVKNDLGIRHYFTASSSPFSLVGLNPTESWIRAGETINVIVRIAVPNVEEPAPNTVTLYVHDTENFEVVKKSTYVYVQGSSGAITTDNEKPNIDYSFNDNCAGKLHRDRCARSRWSVDIIANDPDSGLKRIYSLPSGVQPRTEFIAGTKNIVNFYYTATCCETTVDITATDVQGNSYTRTIDVTAWNNLSQGEIAAIIVGALLILLMIILIILIIIYCIRKRKSHDLSYSQRYGSRTPASAERTNF